MGHRGRNGHSIEPDRCTRWDEKHGRPVRAMLRGWTGAEEVVLGEELASLRNENSRLTGVVECHFEGSRDRRPAPAPAECHPSMLMVDAQAVRGGRGRRRNTSSERCQLRTCFR